ncbi:MAG: hypothetical protein JRG76_00205 [Deltaproteobacteria bacterium]|nr:hypothetical protein [Deltaproteobacteria bacterium]MBW2412901.1 hypothetical protein [Deltaproteobacteria bacterium]
MPTSRSPARGTWLTRRELIVGGGALIGGLALAPRLRAEGVKLSEPTLAALGESPIVYVSPLHPDGGESKCHGEVWFFVDGGDVVVGVDRERWKARALKKGWDRARIWAGDFGPVAKAGDKYRSAPQFEARGSIDAEPATFDRLMQAYAKKYADEWEKWGPRFQKSYADGSRVLIRYNPVAEGPPAM